MVVMAGPDTPAGGWLALRAALWPTGSVAGHAAEIEAIRTGQTGTVAFLFFAPDTAEAVGFAEASLRHDYVNGCETSPVGFLEGIHVDPAHRGQGIARRLAQAAEDWARAKGCAEFASDAALDNTASHAMHAALGFEETERVVCFRKRLAEP